MSVSDRPIIDQEGQEGDRPRRPPRRRLEGRLRRLRDRDDGLLPADVADQHHQPAAEARHRRLFRPGQRLPVHLRLRRHPGGHRAGRRRGQEQRLGLGHRTARARGAAEPTKDAGQSSKVAAPTSTAPPNRPCRTPWQKREEAAFESAAQSLRQAMQDMPELAELSKQVLIDQTPEGLRIQLVDQEGRSMFDPGSAKPNDRAKVLLRAVAKIAQQAAQPHHHRRPHQRQRRRHQVAGRLAAVVRPRRRRAPDHAGRRHRPRPHLSGVRQGRLRPARSRTIRPCPVTAASPSSCCANCPSLPPNAASLGRGDARAAALAGRPGFCA